MTDIGNDNDANTDTSITVLAATGKIGRRLVPLLRAAGHTVRPASRSSATRFDWADTATWSAVLTARSALFLVVPETPVPIEDFVRRADDAGVGRIVLLSGRGADDYESFEPKFGTAMLAAERAVRAAAAEWTVLRPNNFDQNFDEDLFHAPLLAGELALPTGGIAEPFVDAGDVAAVAAEALTGTGHAGRTYELSGPEALTFGAAVAIIAEAAGRQIGSADISPEEFATRSAAEGLPAEAAEELNAMFALMRSGLVAPPTDDVREVLGREPRDFRSYARAAAAAGAWTP